VNTRGNTSSRNFIRPKTKIVATLGPASSSQAMLRKMIIAGLDCVRLNFSHGSQESHIASIELVRSLNKKLRRHIRIMQDLEGYRIRIGALRQPVTLKKRKIIYLTQKAVTGTTTEVPFDYHGSLAAIKPQTLIYIDDGKIVLEVLAAARRRLTTKVVRGGLLQSHKGINIPNVRLDFSALTEKDRHDLNVAVDYRLDYLAQSFVRKAQDLRVLKGLVVPRHPSCKFFAKIENQQALNNLDEIIDEADGIIVARGDLGICVPVYKVPVIQKDIIKRCRSKKKPVVVATQMLDSMVTESIPTRAEVSDVANAIFDGATHVMLSAETTVGKHPDMVVRMMNKIVVSTESYLSGKI